MARAMFDFRNGRPLKDLLIPEGLSHAATSFVESLKINSITEKVRRDRRVVIKRRNVYGERGADLINFYFRAAGIPIRYLSDVREWRRSEARCLWEHMNRGTLTLLHRTLAIDSARKRRRPSISCQRTRPGMPTIKSRKRASKDMAKAVSPGMPRRLPTTR